MQGRGNFVTIFVGVVVKQNYLGELMTHLDVIDQSKTRPKYPRFLVLEF